MEPDDEQQEAEFGAPEPDEEAEEEEEGDVY